MGRGGGGRVHEPPKNFKKLMQTEIQIKLQHIHIHYHLWELTYSLK